MQVCPEVGHLESLRKLVPDAQFLGARDIRIAGCATDPRELRSDDLLVALDAARIEPDFIAEAIARGCCGILADRPLPEANIPVCLVANAREAYGLICQALAGNPCDTLKVIGVTGANGKTTTSCLIAGVLAHAGNKVGLLSRLGYFDGDDAQYAAEPTPQPDRLASLMARMVRNGCSHAVMDVSHRALEQSRAAGVYYDAACVTNFHGEDGSRLFDHLKADGLMVVNADDPAAAACLRQIDGPALTVGITSSAEITGTPIEQFPSEQTFLITAGSDTMPVRTQMIGRHHIYNCLTAAAVGLAYGIDLPRIVRTLEAAKHVPGRLERIECGQPFNVFVDYARTPEALAGSLQALRAVAQGRLICVFGTGARQQGGRLASGGRQSAESIGNPATDARQSADDVAPGPHPLLGRVLEAGADAVILTSANPPSNDPAATVQDLLCEFTHPDRTEIIFQRRAAIHRALSLAQTGDCVLIAGTGCETLEIDDAENPPSDDRRIASDWLYEVRPFANG